MTSRSDYEIWLMKWLGEKSDNNQEEELHAFLSGNPDIRETPGGPELQKENHNFPNKSSLLKTSGDLPDDQFDYLCAAMVENDLGPEGEKELLDITSGDKERRKTFEIFRKSKLIAGKYVYYNKNLLKKKTALQRFLLPAISSAAGIALLMAVFLQGNNEHVINVPDNNTREISQFNPGIPNPQNNPASPNFPDLKREEKGLSGVTGVKPSSVDIAGVQPYQAEKDRESYPAFQSHFIPAAAVVFIEGLPDLTTALIPIRYPELYAINDERPRVEKFLTRAYRELLLGEKDDRPLNRYELAKGGVNGLNRILGWEMAVLPEGNDEGDIESFRFSSKILNFNVPLKKNEDRR